MDQVHLALIGCGGFGAGHAREIAANPDALLAVVCDTNRDQAQMIAERTGARVYTDYERALDSPGLDGAIVATPNYLHARITCAAARRGLPILCEKPMATTLADARRMNAVCQGEGVALMIGLSSRYDRSFKAALDLVRSGKLGDLLLISNVYYYTPGPVRPGRTWHNDPTLMGGGALIQMGIHSIDRIHWFADADVASVYAQTRKAGGRWSDNVALCTITFSNGALGQIKVAGVASASRNEMTVHLSQGEIIVRRGQVRWYDGDWHKESFPTDVLAAEIEDFVGVILADRHGQPREPFCSGEMALPAHELCFAAYRSAAEGRLVYTRDGYV